MALAINIDDLLNKQRIESNRIEFTKDGSTKDEIRHTKREIAYAEKIERGLII